MNPVCGRYLKDATCQGRDVEMKNRASGSASQRFWIEKKVAFSRFVLLVHSVSLLSSAPAATQLDRVVTEGDAVLFGRSR